MGYDSAGAFVKALGIRALSDPEDDVGPPVEKERGAAFLQRIFGVCFDVRQELGAKRCCKTYDS